MENSPTIILFWVFIVAIFVLMVDINKTGFFRVINSNLSN